MGNVVLVLITLGVALVVGYARGGRLRRVLGVRLRRGRLVLTSLALAVLGVALSWTWAIIATVLWSLAMVTVVWFCRLNRHVHGAGLVAAGLLLDVVAGLEKVVPDAPYAVTILGDIIPVALPWTVERVAAGDILLAAGLATILATSMVGANTPTIADAAADETLVTSHQQEEHHGEAGTQAQGPEEERREPREAAEQLTHHPA